MSYLWSFQSFSFNKFNVLFGGGSADARKRVLEAVTWDEGAWEVMSPVENVVAHIVSAGINYQGLSDEEAETLDQMMPMVFSPEGLEEELEVESESPDFLPPRLVEESVRHAEGNVAVSYLCWLVHGHRYGVSDSDVICEYCILKPEEVMLLHKEITEITGLGTTWRDPRAVATLDQRLVKVLERVAGKRKALIGLLG